MVISVTTSYIYQLKLNLVSEIFSKWRGLWSFSLVSLVVSGWHYLTPPGLDTNPSQASPKHTLGLICQPCGLVTNPSQVTSQQTLGLIHQPYELVTNPSQVSPQPILGLILTTSLGEKAEKRSHNFFKTWESRGSNPGPCWECRDLTNCANLAFVIADILIVLRLPTIIPYITHILRTQVTQA